MLGRGSCSIWMVELKSWRLSNMSVFVLLTLFGVFWVSLVYAEGGLQFGFSIAAVVGIFLFGLYGIYRGQEVE